MSLTKTDHKTGLMLCPEKLLSNQPILESLHIKKLNGILEYKSRDLEHGEVLNYYSHLPVQAKKVLPQFNKASLQDLKIEIRSRFNEQKAGISYELYFKNVMIRHFHELFQTLKPYAPLLKWYHKHAVEKGRFVTASCSFSNYKPVLEFEVKREGQNLKLETLINLNGSSFPFSQFTRYHFLLKSKNEFFLLSFKDFQTLEWLEVNHPKANHPEPMQGIRNIVARLEPDYPVKSNNLLPKNEVEVAPYKRVMLSEISNSFLVLTPQFIYDGFLVEGAWKENHETIRQGETFSIKRDREAETEFLSLLESLHANFPRQLNGYYYLSFAEAEKKQWFLKVYHRLLAENIELAGMDMLQHFRYSSHEVDTQAEIIKQEADLVIIKMKVSFGNECVLLSELQKLLRVGQRTVMLKDGSFGVLHDEWLKQYEIIFRHGKIIDSEIRLVKWLAFSDEVNENSNLLKPVLNIGWQKKWQDWQADTGAVYPVPTSVNATLRPYQKKGFEWMVLLSEMGAGACLADDMGLGKTLQTICFLAHRLEIEPCAMHLIICPSSLIYNWQKEIEKFAPQIATLVYHGATRKAADLTDNNHQIIITSYGTMRSDIEQMADVHFGVVILDESHYIKNPAAQVTHAVGQLKSVTRIALTGTPLINNTVDLYSQFNFILPGLLGTREFFNREYANNIDRNYDTDKIKYLKKLTAPFILRRTKVQVASDLPSKNEMVMWCSMKPSQRLLYDEMKSRIRDSIFLNIKNEGLNRAKLAVLQGMLRLRQLCNSPLLLPEEEQTCSESVKTELLLNELTSNLKDHKVLVFSQFTRMLNLLAESCSQQGIAYYHFDGQTPPAKRYEMVARFQEEGDTTNVFLISLKAGNTGLNLTAADYVFLFDPWWNTAVQQQAIDRTHRIGQTKNVFAYKMICKDSIEERIIQIQERKKLLSDDLISEEEGFVKSLTEEEIEYLFS